MAAFNDRYNKHMAELERREQPIYRATQLRTELELLMSTDPSQYSSSRCENKYGISRQGYKLAYSICGFLCTQIIDLDGKYDYINNSLGAEVTDNSNEIIDFINDIIYNRLDAITPKTHELINVLIKSYEARLNSQGKHDLSFIFRESVREFFGKIDSSYSKGCYIATYVFSNYNAPEVRILRTFRDARLMKSKSGRTLTHFYYFISQHALIKFGKYKWFNSIARRLVNIFIHHIEITN